MDPSLDTDLGAALPPSLLRLWRRRGVETLLPLQRRALRETGLLSGRNLLVVAPSSAGKTLIGEIALARALSAGRRAVFLTPTRALAEQQFAAFARGLAGSGLRVLCATADRPESDAPARAGRYDLLVAVYEKFRALMMAHGSALAGVAAVAVDEIQMLADPERGGALDLLLTRLLHSPAPAQLVALAPELARPEALARWLRADLLLSQDRPRALREGVLDLASGRFRFRTEPGGEEGEESLGAPEELDRLLRRAGEVSRAAGIPCGEDTAALLAGAACAARAGGGGDGRTLLFAPTRRCSRRWARVLAGMELGFPAARVALAGLDRAGERGRICDRLAGTLERGIAFHNADLGAALRRRIEAAFGDGELGLLVCTPTLGMGVNLPARAVVHTPWRLGSPLELAEDGAAFSGDSGGPSPSSPSVPLPLGRARFTNQGGRAARLGLGDGPGRSILVAQNSEQAERLWETLVLAPDEGIDRPPLAGRSTAWTALSLLADGKARPAARIAREFESTFSHCVAAPVRGLTEAAAVAAFREAQSVGLARESEDGVWSLTGLGEAALHADLAPASMQRVVRASESWSFAGPEDAAAEVGLLLALALTDEGRAVSAGLPFARRGLPLPLPESMAGEEETLGRAFVDLLGSRGGPSRTEVAAAWTACALADWSVGLSTEHIEAKYDVYAGGLASAGEAMARLVTAASDVRRALDPGSGVCDRLAQLAERLQGGVGAEGLRLARLRVEGLSRDAVSDLVAAGWASPAALLEAPRDRLEAIVGADILDQLEAAAREAQARAPEAGGRAVRAPGRSAAPQSEKAGAAAPPASETRTESGMPLLELNLQSPGVVRFGGCEVRLPPLLFDLLAALAERPGEVVTRAALYHRLWPEGGPEEQQLDAHRRRLAAKLGARPDTAASGVVEGVRGLGFRLALAPHLVSLRTGSRREESGCAPALRGG